MSIWRLLAELILMCGEAGFCSLCGGWKVLRTALQLKTGCYDYVCRTICCGSLLCNLHLALIWWNVKLQSCMQKVKGRLCIWDIQCPGQCQVSPKLSASAFLILQVRCFHMPWYWVVCIGHHPHVVFTVWWVSWSSGSVILSGDGMTVHTAIVVQVCPGLWLCWDHCPQIRCVCTSLGSVEGCLWDLFVCYSPVLQRVSLKLSKLVHIIRVNIAIFWDLIWPYFL